MAKLNKKIMVGLIMGTLLFGGSLDANDKFEAFQKKEYKGLLNYRIYTPENMDHQKKYPLIIYFHGAGSRGNDNTRHLTHGAGELLAYSRESGNPAIIIAPQCPKDKRWVNIPWKIPECTMPKEPSSPMKLAIELLQDTISKLPVDKERIYVTGLSMGGFATWDIVARMPGTFAAAMPICGGGDAKMAAVMKNVPIWIFHGGADKTVATKYSQDMAAALKKVGGKVKYTEYEGVGHDSWTRTYTNKEVLKWLFNQKKDK